MDKVLATLKKVRQRAVDWFLDRTFLRMVEGAEKSFIRKGLKAQYLARPR